MQFWALVVLVPTVQILGSCRPPAGGIDMRPTACMVLQLRLLVLATLAGRVLFLTEVQVKPSLVERVLMDAGLRRALETIRRDPVPTLVSAVEGSAEGVQVIARWLVLAGLKLEIPALGSSTTSPHFAASTPQPAEARNWAATPRGLMPARAGAVGVVEMAIVRSAGVGRNTIAAWTAWTMAAKTHFSRRVPRVP